LRRWSWDAPTIRGGTTNSASGNATVIADEAYEALESELELTAASVSIPADWEAEFTVPDSWIRTAVPGSIGVKASPDLSSSGTWMLLLVAPNAMSEGGDSPEERFWSHIEMFDANETWTFDQEPVAISMSGLDGYSYEISGGKGPKTGRDLGGFLAIFYGSEYTYQIIIQFYIPDRNDMSALFQDTLTGLTFTSNDGSI
jgi:hypothetical protein